MIAKKVKSYLNKSFSDFRFFHLYLGNKIFLALILSFTVGLMDGLGLAMFIPLLQMVDGSTDFQPNEQNIGNLKYLLETLNAVGLPLTLTTVLLMILFFFGMKGLFRFAESYFGVILMTTFIKKIRFAGVESISSVNYKYFVKVDSGKIQNTLSGEVDRVTWAYRNYMAGVQSLMAIVVYITLAFLSNPQFALLVGIGGGISNFFYTKLYRKTKQTSRKITADGHIFHGLVMQQINNFKYLRATGQASKFGEKLKKTIVTLAQGNRKIGFFNSLLIATKEPMSIFVVVGIIFIQIFYFSTNIGPIILSLLFFYRALNAIIVYQNYWNTFLNVSGSLENFQGFLHDMNSNRVDYNSGEVIETIESIELIDAKFSYGQQPLLKNINLEITKNKTIALVGPSGSGKTTLINIITGLLPIEKGSFRINGIEQSELNMNEYQSKIGYITQEPVIFNDTLFNNVTTWAEKTPENLIKFKNALKKASLLTFLEGLAEKEDAPLGNAGILISGGQKQRIAIARELYKEVDLLVLDEATSALDSETEKEIQEYFDQLRGEYTIIVIAHRLSTIKNSDIIYLLKDGQILNHGNFESLTNESSNFKKMVALQNFDN
ncbi:MAG: ABC transporter ATP-binding protein [Cytophagales bacterium]|uniref:ABC transporter related protein n=2 Tax=Cyclobacterium marinum TaxID=104 RepID=G0J0S6_CYCMS|nr:ABC transporter related protein [Cyclobacterium marinum DSM 745]MBI0399149.1 ABC transporter ATP-binding protein [Cyclobacterium marinum]MBR9777550.1 ABC transporter ATP-binding protein [Cytophagales bacterium]